MSFGQVIKKLRRNADMTQEQLAEMLSISPQAVSRWETDTAMPDISLLRPLSNIFSVTADVLLEIDVSRVNESVESYKQRITESYRNHKYQEMLDLARLACKEIPNNLELVGQLAFALTSGENVKKEENIDEAISLYMLILEKSVDNILRFRATSALCRLYVEKKDNKEQALYFAKQLPKGLIQTSSYLMMQYDLIADDEKNETYRLWIEQYVRAITDTIYLLADPNYKNSKNDFSVTQRIELLEKSLSIFEIVYGENLLSVNREFYEINRVIGALYLLEHNYEEALDSFEKAAGYAIAFDSYKDGDLYSSLIMYGIETDEHNLWDNSAVQDMLERLTKQSKYDVLKGNERYKTIVLNLEKAL